MFICRRYMGRWRSPQAMEIQPPFLRPPLTEAQLEAKVLDNGIQNDRHSTRVSVAHPRPNVGTPQTSSFIFNRQQLARFISRKYAAVRGKHSIYLFFYTAGPCARRRHRAFLRSGIVFKFCFLSESSLTSRFWLFQSKSSLDPIESQSADAEPPPPPKPELRYPGLSRADTEGEAHTHTRTSQPRKVFHATDHPLPHLSTQKAACWLRLRLRHQCTSTDQPTAVQEGTTQPSHTPTRYTGSSDVKLFSVQSG